MVNAHGADPNQPEGDSSANSTFRYRFKEAQKLDDLLSSFHTAEQGAATNPSRDAYFLTTQFPFYPQHSQSLDT